VFRHSFKPPHESTQVTPDFAVQKLFVFRTQTLIFYSNIDKNLSLQLRLPESSNLKITIFVPYFPLGICTFIYYLLFFLVNFIVAYIYFVLIKVTKITFALDKTEKITIYL